MIHDMLKELGPRSGRIHLSAQQYNITEPILIDRPCVRLEGEVWAYSSDPNGVFESHYGTQLRLRGNGNILMNNIADGDVIIEGDGNVISGLVLTKPEARLHLRGENNQVWGVPQERIHQM